MPSPDENEYAPDDAEVVLGGVWSLDRLDDKRAMEAACDRVYAAYERGFVTRVEPHSEHAEAARQRLAMAERGADELRARREEQERRSVDAPKEAVMAKEIDDRDQRILNCIGSGASTGAEVVKRVEMSRTTVYDSIALLVEAGKVVIVGTGRGRQIYLAGKVPTDAAASSSTKKPSRPRTKGKPAPNPKMLPYKTPVDSATSDGVVGILYVERDRLLGELAKVEKAIEALA